MVEIKYSGSEDASFRIMYKEPGSAEEKSVPYSGYLVRKGAALSIQLEQTEKPYSPASPAMGKRFAPAIRFWRTGM